MQQQQAAVTSSRNKQQEHVAGTSSSNKQQEQAAALVCSCEVTPDSRARESLQLRRQWSLSGLRDVIRTGRLNTNQAAGNTTFMREKIKFSL